MTLISDTVTRKEQELEGLIQRYDQLKAQGLPEEHPKVQFAAMEFIRTHKEWRSIQAAAQ